MNDKQAPATLSLTRPDDWHLHLRDGEALQAVAGASAAQFARAIVMPNLKPPVTTVAQALAYRERILAALPAGSDFEPLMTLYLTDVTPADEILRAAEGGVVRAVKLYPAGATTNSDAGVTDIAKPRAALEAMQRVGMPLLVHGEVTDPDIDVFDREAVFIDRVLEPLRRDFPALRIVFEHITTREAAQYVEQAGDGIGATITAHHLLYNRNAIFSGGLRPHWYCLPVLKREIHRQALVAAATELYATAFERAGALDRLEALACFNGPDFYRLPRNTGRITLRRERWTIPESLPFGDDDIVPLAGGEPLDWRLVA